MIGKLVLSNDLSRDIGPHLGPYQIICLNTENSNPEILCGSILLPPYSLMSMLVESEDACPLMMVADQYFEYLHTHEPMSFIAGILAILLKGISVVIYIGEFDGEFSIIPQTIIRLFNVRYGMFIEPNGNGLLFNPEPMYSDQVYSDLYMFDYCDTKTLTNNHSPHPYNADVYNKIIRTNSMVMSDQTESVLDPFVVIRGGQAK